MIHELAITEHNTQVHLDIESDIAKQKDGLFTFILRVNNGNVVDYSVVEYANATKYLVLKKVTIEEHLVPLNIAYGNQPNPIRTIDRKHPA